jgi:cytoskeleton protein RodZ
MTDHEQEPEDTGQESRAPAALPGHRLKLTREDLRLSKDEVAHHLHLDVNIVEALESDDYEQLPSPAYICGYLRSYARILKLPEDEIVNAYSKGQEINAALIPESVNMEPSRQLNPAIMKTVVAIILVLLFAAGFMWLASKFHMFDTVSDSRKGELTTAAVNESRESTVIERPEEIQEKIQQYNAESTIPESTASDAVVEQQDNTGPLLIDETESSVAQESVSNPVDKGDLRLVLKEESWIEVTDSRKERHVYRLADKGTEIFVVGVPPYTVLLGNAEGVDVFYKNQQFDHTRFQREEIAYFRVGTAEE